MNGLLKLVLNLATIAVRIATWLLIINTCAPLVGLRIERVSPWGAYAVAVVASVAVSLPDGKELRMREIAGDDGFGGARDALGGLVSSVFGLVLVGVVYWVAS